MTRNYQKEYEWSRNKYTEIRARIPKDSGKQLLDRLQRNNTTVAEWIRHAVDEYLAKTN